jgi:hypothetical protein
MKFPAIVSDRFKTIGVMTIALLGTSSASLWQSRPAQAVTLNYETQISGDATVTNQLWAFFGVPSGPQSRSYQDTTINSGQITVTEAQAAQLDQGELQFNFLELSRFLGLPSIVQQRAATLADQVKIDFAGTGNLRSAQGETPFSFSYHNPGDMDVTEDKWKTLTVNGYKPEVVKSCLFTACTFETGETLWQVAQLVPSQAKIAGLAAPLETEPVTLLSGNFRYVVNTRPQEQIPTPALLPGLVGITTSLWRRKRSKQGLIPA